MYVRVSSISILIVSFIVSPSLSWELPAKQYLETFVQTFQMEGINIFLPDSRSNKGHVLSVMKHLRYVTSSTLYLYWYLYIIFSETGISVSAVDEKRIGNMSKNPKILYVTAASTYKTNALNDTMKFLTQNFVNREKSDKNIWLFGLDISVHDMLETKNM